MEVTLETISQQMQAGMAELKAGLKADKAELKADIDHLESKVDSVKTWFVGLSFSTVFVVLVIVSTFLNMLIAR